MYDKISQEFKWLCANKIIAGMHQIVRNRLGDWTFTAPITTYRKISKGKFDYEIGFDTDIIQCSSTHEFIVFEPLQGRIVRIQACDLNQKEHYLVYFLTK